MITNKQSYLTGYMVGCRLREGRPSGVMEQWETLFEGDVTTTHLESAGADDFGADVIATGARLPITAGTKYRLSVDGQMAVYTAYTDVSGQTFLGNHYIVSDDKANEVDDGYDYFLYTDNLMYVVFCSRIPGTYSVKIERLAT